MAPRTTEIDEAEARRILSAVSQASGIRAASIMGWDRSSEVALARQVYQFMLIKRGGYNAQQVAKYMGCDHSSIWYAIQRVKFDYETGGERALVLSRAAILLPNIALGQPIPVPPKKPKSKRPVFDENYKPPVGHIDESGAIICAP